jgi:DNA invertase Pin-like site-specific DNA recombinase
VATVKQMGDPTYECTGDHGVWVTDARVGLRGAWCQQGRRDVTGTREELESYAARARAKFPGATYEVRPYEKLQKPFSRRAVHGRRPVSAARAVVYLRVSTADQAVENQLPSLELIAEARGFKLVKLFDELESTRKARPVFDRMMLAARRGEFDVLLVWALDRFGRDTIGNLLAVRELDRLGVRIVSAQDSWLDTTGPARELLVAVMSWVAQQERDRRSERTRAGLARARAQGARIGRPHRLTRADVARAKAMRAEGKSIRAIAIAMRTPRATIARALR